MPPPKAVKTINLKLFGGKSTSMAQHGQKATPTTPHVPRASHPPPQTAACCLGTAVLSSRPVVPAVSQSARLLCPTSSLPDGVATRFFSAGQSRRPLRPQILFPRRQTAAGKCPYFMVLIGSTVPCRSTDRRCPAAAPKCRVVPVARLSVLSNRADGLSRSGSIHQAHQQLPRTHGAVLHILRLSP